MTLQPPIFVLKGAAFLQLLLLPCLLLTTLVHAWGITADEGALVCTGLVILAEFDAG